MSTYPEPLHSDPSSHLPPHLNGHKRRLTREHPNGELLPLSDRNAWYYPSHAFESEEEASEPSLAEGNWGHKNTKSARWLRRGKVTAWGPEMEDWEAEERARKRIRLLLPQERRSPSPPSLPHLARSPSPPLVSPYPPPIVQHNNYTSFVLEKSVTHTFRSSLLDELENATNGLIEGEATMKRALGRLWRVMSEDPAPKPDDQSLVPKREDEDMDGDEDDDDQARRVARAPDLTPATQKIFLMSFPGDSTPNLGPEFYATAEQRLPILDKSLAALHELQDDEREYIERLQEIRESLGDIRAQRDVIWDYVRQRAVKEMQETAFATVEM